MADVAPPFEQDRPTCSECNERLVPPRTTERGSTSKRCLCCARNKRMPGWKRKLSTMADAWGEEVARQIAAEQGVPYLPQKPKGEVDDEPTRPARPQRVVETGDAIAGRDVMNFALGLYAHTEKEDAAMLAGLEGLSKERLESLAAEARRKHKHLAEGSPAQLGKMAFVLLVRLMLKLQDEVQHLSAGQAAQLVKPLREMWMDFAGTAVLGGVTLDFGNLDDEHDDEYGVQRADSGSVQLPS